MAAHGATSDPWGRCSLDRTLEILGERWTFWVLREALIGTTRFAQFRDHLTIASDVLATRLSTLVDAGVMERRSYQEPGKRSREDYHLTAAGKDLMVVLGALQQWGDDHIVDCAGPSTVFRTLAGEPVSVRFVDGQSKVLAPAAVCVESATGAGITAHR